MKRSKNINLSALNKKKQEGAIEDVGPLVVMGIIGVGAFGLYSLITSGSSPNESYHRSNYTQYSGACCISASKTFDNLQGCQPIGNNEYDTNNACQVTVKANGELNTFNIYKGQCNGSVGQNCSTTHSHGSNWAIPAAMLLFASSSNRGYYHYPVSASSSRYNSITNSSTYKNTNSTYHNDQKYTVTKNKAPVYKSRTISTKSRGGFGSTASSKSYWGSSSSSHSSWGG